MRATYALTTAFSVLLLATVSCKKSNPGPGSSSAVQGNWNFLFMTASTVASATSSGVTSVTYTNYRTINNTGTVTFTKDSMAVKGLAYSVDTTALTYIYFGTTLTDSVYFPFKSSVPATTQTVSYKIIGSDSIYLPNGGIVPAGLTGPGTGTGGRFAITNDTLKITVQASQSASGASESVKGTIYMKRQ